MSYGQRRADQAGVDSDEGGGERRVDADEYENLQRQSTKSSAAAALGNTTSGEEDGNRSPAALHDEEADQVEQRKKMCWCTQCDVRDRLRRERNEP
jgi:hypothetical protein